MTKNVHTLQHPLKGGFLKSLRDKDSDPENFRRQAKHLGHLLAVEATRDLNVKPQSFQTPICDTQEEVACENIALVPILRAGIGLVDPFLDFLPNAHVHFLGMFRDEKTHDPVSYYNKLPSQHNIDVAYVLDPMLATGGSAIMTVEAVKAWGVKHIKFIGLIGAPEGVTALHDKFPEVDVHLAALDEKLNEKAYIVPGLGDAGDRIFNS